MPFAVAKPVKTSEKAKDRLKFDSDIETESDKVRCN